MQCQTDSQSCQILKLPIASFKVTRLNSICFPKWRLLSRFAIWQTIALNPPPLWFEEWKEKWLEKIVWHSRIFKILMVKAIEMRRIPRTPHRKNSIFPTSSQKWCYIFYSIQGIFIVSPRTLPFPGTAPKSPVNCWWNAGNPLSAHCFFNTEYMVILMGISVYTDFCYAQGSEDNDVNQKFRLEVTSFGVLYILIYKAHLYHLNSRGNCNVCFYHWELV